MRENDKNFWLVKQIRDYVNNSPENSLNIIDEKAWGEPLIGFANGADELFRKIKEDIGNFYWEPIDIYKLTYPESDAAAEDLSIISWILPQTEQTKSMQRAESNLPSHRWVLSRKYGDDFNKSIAQFIVSLLKNTGCESVSPMISPLWENKNSEKYGYASTWSERHTAYVCGLGTFGICDGLITPAGKAMRCGSVIAKISIKPSERPYSKWNEYCLYYSQGACMACARRCPVHAISEHGHDKIKCRQYQREVIRVHTMENYQIESTCCGLCQTDVPCESGIPGITNAIQQGNNNGLYKIVKLEPKDYHKCENIWDMAKDPERTKKWYNELVNGNRITFIYTVNEEFIGEGSLVLKNNDPDYTIPGKRIYLSRMIVKFEYRNCGIGGIILDYLIDYAKQFGYGEISIGVDIDNLNARHLYEKKGFTNVIFQGKDEIGEYVKLLKRV